MLIRRTFVTLAASSSFGLLIACGSGGNTGGGGNPDAAVGAGGAAGATSTGCTSDAECKGSRICTNGTCVDPGGGSGGAGGGAAGAGGIAAGGSSGGGGVPRTDGGVCIANGNTCAKNADCCSFVLGAGSCVNFGSGLVCADTCTTNAGCTSGCCATLTGGAKACGPATACSTTKAGIGDACTSSAACKSGNCTSTSGGWCTTSCTQSIPGCDGDYPYSSYMWNKYTFPNWCITNSGGTNTCFPGCSTNSDCLVYPGTTCQNGSTTLGTAVTLCSK